MAYMSRRANHPWVKAASAASYLNNEIKNKHDAQNPTNDESRGRHYDNQGRKIAWSSTGASPSATGSASGIGSTNAKLYFIIAVLALLLLIVSVLFVVFIIVGGVFGPSTDKPKGDSEGTTFATATEAEVPVSVTTDLDNVTEPAVTVVLTICDIDNGGCSHGCELTPESRVCTCPESQFLQEDAVTCAYNYSVVLHKSLLFYEAQRSGELPANNRIPWRGDSALDDIGNEGEDLSGGYYDAGDHLKLGLPMAWSATVLTWGFIEFRDAYEAAGEVDNMLACIKWFTDYFIKCHTGENEFYVQVGSVKSDHNYWGRPETMTMERPAFQVNETHPGSDCVGGTAAAMAAASIAFRDYDANYSAILLEEAESLYEFATNYTGKYSVSVPEAAIIYDSSGYKDEVTWAAIWLHLATNEQKYLDDAVTLFESVPPSKPFAFSWGDTTAGYRLLLLKATQEKSKYLKLVADKFVDNWRPGGGLVYTPQGQVWRHEWGSLRYSTATAFIALMVAHYGYYEEEYIDWAKSQVNIALGDTGRSFVIGYGVNPPQRPHHRSSSCPDLPDPCGWPVYNEEGPNHQVLHGALVGGPNKDGEYEDRRDLYLMNEVTLDYNAGFQSAVAALKHFHLKGML